MTTALLAIDQGTTSSRAIIFDQDGRILRTAQQEFRQIYPQLGWVEHDPEAIWDTTQAVCREVLQSGEEPVAAIGITNQRETVVVWNRKTGKPVYNAIVWQDTRTDKICTALAGGVGQNRFRDKTGLPLATYFSGPKVKWLLENVTAVRQAADKGTAL
ncbi:MAG: glycerol kinase, partial [Candidatus Competibacteraceae bacterium]|nr:glycerol kinase [Candidatus Competibacteraceae bacterium]